MKKSILFALLAVVGTMMFADEAQAGGPQQETSHD